MPDLSDVVITGIGVVSPIGVGREAFWESLAAGRSGIADLDGIDQQMFPVGFGAAIRDFDPKEFVRPRKALKVLSRELQTAYAASMMALEQAGLEPGAVDPERVGTVFGSEMLFGPAEELKEAFRRALKDSRPMLQAWGDAFKRDLFPLWMLKYLPNMAACHVGIAVDARGPNNTQVLEDTSSLAAVIEAASVLRRGAADVMLTGGTGTRVNETRLLYYGSVPYAQRREPPESSSRPFAADRDGMVGGEGAATFVLETAEHAAARGVRPLARLAGSAIRLIGAENGRRGSRVAIARVIEAALESAGIDRAQVSHVDAHAMGDTEMDAVEAAAVHETLPGVPVTAGKSLFGHLGAGCGAVEMASAALALIHGQIPPTRHVERVGDDCPVEVVRETDVATRGSAVVKISHTPQGHAVAVVLEAV